MVIITNINKETYEVEIDNYIDEMRQVFIHHSHEYKRDRELFRSRFREIEFKFKESDNKSYKLRLNNFITQLVMMYPFVVLDKDLVEYDDTFVINPKDMNNRYLSSYMDDKFIMPYMDKFGYIKVNKVLARWRVLLLFGDEFTELITPSYSLIDEIDQINMYKLYDDLLNTRIPKGKSPGEIEEFLDKETDKLFHHIMNDPYHPYRYILPSGEGIKKPQAKEQYISGGMKPDIDGKIIPAPLDFNYTTTGMSKISEHLIDANSAKKANLLNDKFVGTSGYLARKIELACYDTNVSKTLNVCDSKHFVNVIIYNEKYVNALRFRNYIGEDGEIKQIKDKDYGLIGKTIKLLSPITCNGEDICHTCFGKFYKPASLFNIGIIAGSILSEPITQKILSAKHLLQSNVIRMLFPEIFSKYLNIDFNKIELSEDIPKDILSKLYIQINKDDIISVDSTDIAGLENTGIDEMSEEDLYREYIYSFSLGIDGGIKEKISELSETPKELILTPYLTKLLKKNKYGKIYLSKIDMEEQLFEIEICNNELTKPLHDLSGLLDIKKKREFLGNYDGSIDSFVQTGFDLMAQSGIKDQFIIFEIVARSLIKDRHCIYDRPDFSQEHIEYVIQTISESLLKHASPIVTLAFEDLKRKLTSPEFYKRKGRSTFENYFCVIPGLESLSINS